MSDRQLPQLPPAGELGSEDLFLLHQTRDHSSRKLTINQLDKHYLVSQHNLADIPNPARARENLGIDNDAMPIGSILLWATECLPDGWLPCDGESLSRFCYPALFTILGARYGQGRDNAILTAHNGNIITCTNAANGQVAPATDGNTDFRITVTQEGTSLLPQVTEIICHAATTLENGNYFTIDSVGMAFAVIYRIDEAAPETVIPERTPILVDINTRDNATQVAEKTANTIQEALFNVPDCRGRFVRGQDQGANRDPDSTHRDDRGDGETGDVIGTTQLDALRAHQHDYYYEYNPTVCITGRRNPREYVIWPPAQRYEEKTGLTGDNETRPKNIGLLYIIKAT